jgi:cobalt-zinc-cadmium efflux system membrane fusion protein
MSITPTPSSIPTATALPASRQIRLLALAVAVIVGIALLVALVHRLGRHEEPVPAPLPEGTFRPTPDQLSQLGIQTIGEGSDPSGITATGTISVDEDHSTPVVLPYSGQVRDVFVQAGQRVVQGQPLLSIASPDFVDARNALFAAAATRNTAASQLKVAQDNATRQAAIYQTAGGALKDYRQAQNDLVSAQSALRSADAALGAARDKLSLLGKSTGEVDKLEGAGEVAGIYAQTTYHAPVAGTIATRDVAPGQYVGAGGDKPVMTISNLGHVWLVAQVDQSAAAKVHLGDPVQVLTPAYPGRVFHAVIDNIGATLDPITHRLPVRATVANPDEALKPQMFASFTIQRRDPGSALLVPSSAVIHEGDDARVWVLGRDRILHVRRVTVVDSENGMDHIGAGLAPGEAIVTSGAIFVNEAGLG